MSDSWRRLLTAAVSPLDDGVRDLQVYGWRTPGGPPTPPARRAAVLVGVLDRDRPEIVLTRRAEHLPQHPGQISFPGGAAEEEGESGVVTALREAREEIGLEPEAVDPIGFLDRVDTISDFRVLPVVGWVRHSGPWNPDRREVEEVFTLPLDTALDLGAYRDWEIERHGVRHTVLQLDWEGRTIWGVTAAILHNLATRARRHG